MIILPSADESSFVTPNRFAAGQAGSLASPRGDLLIAGCRSGTPLATAVVERYNELLGQDERAARVSYLDAIDYQFSDSETCVNLRLHVGGADVFLFQSLYDPTVGCGVDHNYMALLIAARAFREQGANHVTAVAPYLAYSRQDKPTKFMREPTTARLMADLAGQAGIDRVIAWAPHTEQIRGFYGAIPVEMLDPLTLFVDQYRPFEGREDVIVVAPDVGASKFVTYFGRALDLDCAIASKFRPAREEAAISEIIGDFRGKSVAIVLDDLISSGGSVYALVRELVEKHSIREVHLGVSHNLCSAQALHRLLRLHQDYHLGSVVVTNSIPQTEDFRALPFFSVRCLSEILARTVNRVHYNRSVSDLFIRV